MRGNALSVFILAAISIRAKKDTNSHFSQRPRFYFAGSLITSIKRNLVSEAGFIREVIRRRASVSAGNFPTFPDIFFLSPPLLSGRNMTPRARLLPKERKTFPWSYFESRRRLCTFRKKVLSASLFSGGKRVVKYRARYKYAIY